MKDSVPGLLSGGSDLQSALRADPSGFPFRSELSLAPLIAFWTRPGNEGSALGVLAQMIGDEILKAAGLLGTIEDPAVIAEHREIVDVLMAAVFPPASWEQDFGAAMIPFKLRGFYATPSMQRLLMSPDGAIQGTVNLDEHMVGAMRLAYAYALVLKRVYDVELDVDYPLVITTTDPGTGLDRHFRMMFDWQFVDVVPQGPVPVLTEGVRQRLRANLLDPAELRDVLPPETFVFRGATIFRAVEVTDQEVLSALKRDLIDRESIVSDTQFMGLQARLRTLFRRPELRLGLAALEGDRVLLLNSGDRLEHCCIFSDSAHRTTAEFAGSVYERAVREGRPVIVSDLAALPERTCIEEQLVESGMRTLLAAPLYYGDRVIGTLGLTSPRPGDLDATHLPKVHEVLPLFSMAVRRSLEELNARIQTQIKERFTAIHPVVEWRFRRAVLDALERHPGGPTLDLPPIVFENVHPLYALADIRGSSTQRALAIQADLLGQLRLARDVLEAAYHARPLPALDEVRYRIEKQVAQVETAMASGAEAGVIGFLRSDVEPLFAQLEAFGAGTRDRIDAYRAALDPRRGTVYRQRQVFEESVTRIVETISAYLDLEAEAAQAMFPHYFEKRKTDGVDHQIYVGASLVEDGRFDPLYLKSLRLWQLMVVCGIAARADQLTAALPLPLRTTHLVLVQHAPLSIRFRFDEKRFDVDGAYDIRYEIVKTRIDKAVVEGTGERVTQPGKIAIVYTQPGEAAEYRGYIEYLQHLGYLDREVEDLRLAELQGAEGLRALRVGVALQAPRKGAVAPAAAQLAPGTGGGRALAGTPRAGDA